MFMPFLSNSIGMRLLRRGEGLISHSHANLGSEIEESTCLIPGIGLPSMNWARGNTCLREPLRKATTSLCRCHQCSVDRGIPKRLSICVDPATGPAHSAMRAPSLRRSSRSGCSRDRSAGRGREAISHAWGFSCRAASASSLPRNSAAKAVKSCEGEPEGTTATVSPCFASSHWARMRCTSFITKLESSAWRVSSLRSLDPVIRGFPIGANSTSC